MNEHNGEAARSKIKKVLSYIRELTKLRTPPIAQLKTYEWSLSFSSLPNYPTIQINQIIEDKENDFDGAVLRVKRPPETQCPPPPPVLADWIEKGWEQLSTEVKHIPARNKSNDKGHTITEQFDDVLERVKAFELWTMKRIAWKEAEIPARDAAQVFSELFKMHGKLQRESEKYQLYLGDGHLVWNSSVEPIDHPILLKKLELEFDPTVPEFILRETDDSSELYTALLRHHELDGNAILTTKARLEEIETHPLAGGKTTDFLKFFIQRFFQDGNLYETREKISNSLASMYRDPVIFLGSRSQGFAEQLDALIESMPDAEVLPESLLRLVGYDEKSLFDGNSSDGSESLSTLKSENKIDFLLTKPANKEQERIISRLEEAGSVLVQGPPGTGKSHTIANIIGHLLASGKTVLVSSHTSKALRVVREKVVKPLQPLCVSVLENDVESKSQLEESINGIVSYLSRTDGHSLTQEIAQLGQRRAQIQNELEELEEKALEIRKGEYTDIVVAGEGIPPSSASRKVAELEKIHGWIPEPMEYGAPLPLSEIELRELYSTNQSLPVLDEKCIAEDLPDLDNALNPMELRELAVKFSNLDRTMANRFSELWNHSNQDALVLSRLNNALDGAVKIFTAHKWIRKVVEDSRIGKEKLQPWHNLIELIQKTTDEVAKRSELILRHGPQISSELSSESLCACREIIAHLKTGKNLGFFSTAFKSSWKKIITESKVDDGVPAKIEHFEAILSLLETVQLRRELLQRWERQIVSIEGPKLESNEPEIFARQVLDALKLAANWTSSWQYIENELEAQGFNIKLAFEKVTNLGDLVGYTEKIERLVEKTIVPSIESRRLWIRLQELEVLREKTLKVLRVNSQKPACSMEFVNRLMSAVEQLDGDGYEAAYNRFLDLKGKVPFYLKRKVLLKKLEKSASGWAKAIELRSGVHGNELLPSKPDIAWHTCQLRQELDRRISQDYSNAQREIQRLKTELVGVNGQYVEKLAWRFQHSRTGLVEKQALTGWQQLQNKITKTGKGKRDVHLKREARKTLKNCKGAVPVWIMPLSRVYESFDLVNTKFDVLLLDEASQSDITALVAFSIAKQVIVVGDDEQVTPHAVGQELGKIQSLIDELLVGIPNRMLYDGKTSVYDLAAQAFGETIRLVEHFRCVPDIIEFSNQLSYNGEIRPLREATSSPYANHVLAHRVDGATSLNKTNHKEAIEVASIVAAMIEMKEYENASIGIISMVGQEQSIAIDSILQKRIPVSEYSKHFILTGNASQFQGDERDVIILSMVDTCDSPPLAIRQSEDFKKTFNVAASRARNQLWVVHSLNPMTDLKSGDLRLRLIQHAENPKNLRLAIEATQKKSDPNSQVFERGVIKDLMLEGFRITPQFSVGAYTIDMVVEGNSKRIAIECDGDRFHPPEKLADDIQRQLVLERLGWKFIRIRGSEYFRHREAAIKRVVSELDALEIERLGPSVMNQEESQTDELHRKVISRALEIRKEWESSTDQIEEVKPKCGRWGKKSESSESSTTNENENMDLFEGVKVLKRGT